jgi:hypothetical protein
MLKINILTFKMGVKADNNDIVNFEERGSVESVITNFFIEINKIPDYMAWGDVNMANDDTVIIDEMITIIKKRSI